MNNEKIARSIYSKKSINKTMKKIKLLGINNNLDVYLFLGSRLASTIIIFIIILFFFPTGYLYAPIISISYYYLIYYFTLDYKINKREKVLEYEALQFFEVLTLCIETGKDLKSSIEITCNNMDGELASEFRQVLKEVDMSKSLNESLRNMRKRIPSDNINNIILNISETSIFGGGIIETMYNQIDFLNEKKIQGIRSEITKLPMKHSIISTLFFVPLILLLILGPIVVNFYYENNTSTEKNSLSK